MSGPPFPQFFGPVLRKYRLVPAYVKKAGSWYGKISDYSDSVQDRFAAGLIC